MRRNNLKHKLFINTCFYRVLKSRENLNILLVAIFLGGVDINEYKENKN